MVLANTNIILIRSNQHTLSIGVAIVEMYYDISVTPLITMRSTFAFATSQLAKAKVFLYQYERY